MDENSEPQRTAEQLVTKIDHHMAQAEKSGDVSNRYFHQRQAELYMKQVEIEVCIDANNIASRRTDILMVGIDNLVKGLFKIAERLR